MQRRQCTLLQYSIITCSVEREGGKYIEINQIIHSLLTKLSTDITNSQTVVNCNPYPLMLLILTHRPNQIEILFLVLSWQAAYSCDPWPWVQFIMPSQTEGVFYVPWFKWGYGSFLDPNFRGSFTLDDLVYLAWFSWAYLLYLVT